ncbi:MAG: aminoacetone oxidase family FAD-binding enzyme [Holophagaceae bacterium]|nr:aminoacetone oxidase family FAD-binding enzyme [Holophagaceae bacterium]
MAAIIVVGGGAAGLVAAWRAAMKGHHVTLLEANGKLGVKLRISGGGKCNITHDGTMKAVAEAFSKAQARFLKPSFHAFSNEDVVALLHREGVETYVRDNGRIFPLDRPGSAAAVVAAFEAVVRRAGVLLRTGSRVVGLEGSPPRVEALRLGDGTRLPADAFILATGGASYPETGTRGEVAGWLEQLGVPTQPWTPALAPIPLKTPHPGWEGVAFRDGILRLQEGEGGRRIGAFAGDILFTRSGISGPAALELSARTESARRAGRAWLAYDFTGLSEAVLDAELRHGQIENPHLSARNWLQHWIPERVADSLWRAEGFGDIRLKHLPKSVRSTLVSWACAFPLGLPGAVPLERGEVAAGGVDLSAVDPHTMRVRNWDNLLVCGELLDVDGPVGGYNLQAAFSTGFLAGESV